MDETKELEEKLRELACVGDLEGLRKLVEVNGVNINSQNNTNGWTALHWASKRGHVAVVSYLLSKGADRSIENNEKVIAAKLTNSQEIHALLGYESTVTVNQSKLPIVPNYLAKPQFPYARESQQLPVSGIQHGMNMTQNNFSHGEENELVLKARVAYSDEKDFIEIELDRRNPTFDALLNLMCRELGVERNFVQKVRKLPDTIVRKDKDVRRLQDFQELELVLTNKVMSASSRVYGITDGIKQEHILY